MKMTNMKKEKSLGYAVGKTNWYLKTLLNKQFKEAGFNITNEQWIVLKVIFENPALSQTQVAHISNKDKTNITRILDLLEKSGYIERRRDDQDRRMNRIHITEKGKGILKAVEPITQKTEDISTRSLSKEQVKTAIQILDMVCGEVKNNV